ncbi:MAG TPA: GumC family protein [Stellaceae bacterium]|jgi:uncharacterized protein involved in exopolysaccharide biosynthesis
MLERSQSLSLESRQPRAGDIDRLRSVWTPPGIGRAAPALAQHWKLIVGFTLLVVAAVTAVLPLMEPRYQVTAKVLVRLGRELSAPPTVTAKEDSQEVITTKRTEDLGSEIEIMKSPQLIEQVVSGLGVDFFVAEPPAKTLFQQLKRAVRQVFRFAHDTMDRGLVLLGVRKPLSPFQRVVLALQSGFSVSEVRNSDVITVQLVTSDPDAGVEVLDKYLALYQAKHREAYRLPKAREFFAAEVDDVRRQLSETEDKAEEFKARNRAWSVETQAGLLLKSQQELEDTHAKTLAQIAELGSRIAELQRQQAALPPELKTTHVDAHDPLVDELRKKLGETEAQAAQVGVMFGERSSQIVGLRRQADELRAAIRARSPVRRDQQTTAANPQLLDTERDIAASQAQLIGLHQRAIEEEEQLQALGRQLEKLNATEAKVRDLERERARLERKYQVYSTGLENSRISDQLELAKISNVKIISQPVASLRPVWPPLLLIFAGALIVGLGGSISFVLMRDALWPVVRSGRDVEELLGLPLLASIADRRSLRL